MDDRIRDVLTKLDVPVEGAVADWWIEVGRDATDDPAVWVFVVVHDEHIEALWPHWNDFIFQIQDAVAEVTEPGTIIYVRMWAASDVPTRATA